MNQSRAKTVFLVNGDCGSAMAERARSFASRLRDQFEIEICYRTAGRLRSMLAMLIKLIWTSPRSIYVFDMAISGVIAALLYRTLFRRFVIIDTGDAIYELSKSMGRGFVGRTLTWCLERISLAGADRIVVRGRGHLAELARDGIAAEWIPDGVDLQQFAPRDATALRRELGVDGALTIGVLGAVIWSEKLQMCYGWELVELIRLCRDRPVKGVVIGDGSGISYLQAKCREYRITDRVVFTGRVDYSALPEYLCALDICLSTQTNDLPGQVRTTGKLPLYLAAGRRVLATRVGEAARVLPDDMLVDYDGTKDPAYPQRLHERVLELERHPHEIECSGVAREIAARFFDYDQLSRRVASVLDPAAPDS